jgi:hypothetical protein
MFKRESLTLLSPPTRKTSRKYKRFPRITN